ncbi:MAG TPA: hypothetical protein VK302_12415 [Terriglobales bacterium]|nr:hypothetical protein [Terriglobales bacterium]
MACKVGQIIARGDPDGSCGFIWAAITKPFIGNLAGKGPPFDRRSQSISRGYCFWWNRQPFHKRHWNQCLCDQ